MTSMPSSVLVPNRAQIGPIKAEIGREIDAFFAALPKPEQLTAEQRRGIIARYTAVLEGNFIYWMTGAYIATKSEEARAKIMENLHEEVRDSHPDMLRKFAIAANALPTDNDTLAVHRNLTQMRLFVGKLSAVPTLVTMAYFEGLIQQFMPYLADLAKLQGSTEMVYTDVHGVCDITHTEELYNALQAEMDLADKLPKSDEMYEGVGFLKTLLENVVTG